MLDARSPNARPNNMCAAVGGGRGGRGVFSDAAQLEWVPPGVTPDLVSVLVPRLGSEFGRAACHCKGTGNSQETDPHYSEYYSQCAAPHWNTKCKLRQK